MVRKHLCESAFIAFFFCVKILTASRLPAFGSAKEFTADKKTISRDERRCFRTMRRSGEIPMSPKLTPIVRTLDRSLPFKVGHGFSGSRVPHNSVSVGPDKPCHDVFGESQWICPRAYLAVSSGHSRFVKIEFSATKLEMGPADRSVTFAATGTAPPDKRPERGPQTRRTATPPAPDAETYVPDAHRRRT